MINFSLNTFIKICLLDTGQRITEIQRRLVSKSGYDFYQSLQKAVRLHASGDEEGALEVLSSPVNPVERKHNQEAFSQYLNKFGGSKAIEAVKSKRVVKFPSDEVSISIDPLFEVIKSETRNVYGLWSTQSPVITQRYGAVACLLMRQAFKNDPLGNANFFYLDLVGNKTFSEKQITNNTSLILSADVSSIGSLIKKL